MSGAKARYLDDVMKAAQGVDGGAIDACIDALESACRDGRQVFVVGNGGSAANASHFAQDLAKGAMPDFEHGRRFRVLSLTDNVSFLTALANDIGYERVFDLQLRQFARPGDVLVTISVSGDSPNVLRAAEYAREIGMATIAFTGFTGGALLKLADIRVHVPLHNMCQSEAVHSILFHMIVDLLRERFARNPA